MPQPVVVPETTKVRNPWSWWSGVKTGVREQNQLLTGARLSMNNWPPSTIFIPRERTPHPQVKAPHLGPAHASGPHLHTWRGFPGWEVRPLSPGGPLPFPVQGGPLQECATGDTALTLHLRAHLLLGGRKGTLSSQQSWKLR